MKRVLFDIFNRFLSKAKTHDRPNTWYTINIQSETAVLARHCIIFPLLPIFNNLQQCNSITVSKKLLHYVLLISLLPKSYIKRSKMAPQMAATVLCSSVFVLFLFVFPVFCFSNTISFTRDELLNIRQNTPHNLFLDFDYSNVLLDIVVGGAATLFRCFRTRRWGKRAGALEKLRQSGLRTPLPSIHLANLRSLPNKTDELLLSQTNKDFSNSAALCFTETWLNDAIPDSMLHLPNFQLIRADRDAESTGKLRGGGTCLYINERWCTDVTVKEDVLSRSRTALLLATGVLFVHSCECLHSSLSARELSFTETRWSDHRHRTKTPGLCFNHSQGL